MRMKNKFVNHFMLLFILTTTAISCIDEYEIPQTAAVKYETEIMIAGRILGGDVSEFYLS